VSPRRVPAATAALRTLRYLATQPGPVPADRIAAVIGSPRSSTYHLLRSMADEGFVVHYPDERRWGLGVAAFEVGTGFARQGPLQRLARLPLARLVDTVGQSAHLAVLHGSQVLYLLEERAPGRPPLVTDVGVRLPAHLTASGRAILAGLPASQVRALFPDREAFVDRHGTGPQTLSELRAVLADTRRRGHATEHGEVTPGFASVAVAVPGGPAPTLASIALTYPDDADIAVDEVAGQQAVRAVGRPRPRCWRRRDGVSVPRSASLRDIPKRGVMRTSAQFERALPAAAVAALMCLSLGTSAGGATADESAARQVDARSKSSTVKLHSMGRGNLAALARRSAQRPVSEPATANPRTEIPPRLLRESEEGADEAVDPRRAPEPGTTPVTGQFPGTLPFESLTVRDSRYANGGNQFTSEPPDQALCGGAGYTMAAVNTAIAVYDRTGAQLAPTLAINEFYGLADEFNRDKTTFGPSAFDPVCLFDQQVRRWFFLTTELDVDPFSGNLTGGSHLFLAVSATEDPLGEYARYSITTTSGDETDRGCPCFDDFPHIGTDANGFYITANRFSIFERPYNGAQLYAISKRGLAANAADPGAPFPSAETMNIGRIADHKSYTVQPAAVPPGGRYPDREYFLTTADVNERAADEIGILALSNTDSLDSDDPDLRLTRNTVPSLRYVQEPNVEQKPGRAPLGESVGEKLNSLDSASAMSEVEFSRGRLWAATGAGVGNHDARRDGVLWFQVRPTFNDGRVDGTMVNQGYVAVETNSLIYPAVGVNAQGQGAMVMSLAGPRAYPSPSYVRMDMSGVSGPVRVPKFGQRPDDGFTCYEAFVGSRERGCRWGDYSAATADARGDVWMATEWISDTARVPFANWSTEVMRYTP
jgi:DNA-binding IclR family transcriptional regulator